MGRQPVRLVNVRRVAAVRLPTSAAFARTGTGLLGISADPPARQDFFKAKHKLKVALASDEALEVLKAYGVWVEKSMYGKKYMGVARITYLIGADGKVARRWDSVKVKEHAEEVLEAVKEL